MQNAAADGVEPGLNYPNDAYRAVISDLVSLIEHVQKSLRLINQAIARETSPGSQESSTNVIVLDDVSPRYMRATAALHSCNADLGATLHALLNTGNIDTHTANARVFSTARA
jgi:hypothetical protein